MVGGAAPRRRGRRARRHAAACASACISCWSRAGRRAAAEQIPDLVDARRPLPHRHGAGGRRLRSSARTCAGSSQREIAAQFDAFAATGLPLDHVNAHKHFHLHPTIAAADAAIGRRHGAQGAARAARARQRAGAVETPATSGRRRALIAPWARCCAGACGEGRHHRHRSGLRPRLVRRHDGAAARRAAAPICRPASARSICIPPSRRLCRRGARLSLRRGTGRAHRSRGHRGGRRAGIRRGGFADFLPASPSPPFRGRGGSRSGTGAALGSEGAVSRAQQGRQEEQRGEQVQASDSARRLPMLAVPGGARGRGCRRRCRWSRAL